MPVISAQSLPTADSDRLSRLYNLKQKQLDRAHHLQCDSLLCRVLAAEADAIGDALAQAMTTTHQPV